MADAAARDDAAAPLCACGCRQPLPPPRPRVTQKYATPQCAARDRQRRHRGGLLPATVVVCRICRRGVLRKAGQPNRRYHDACAKTVKKAREWEATQRP